MQQHDGVTYIGMHGYFVNLTCHFTLTKTSDHTQGILTCHRRVFALATHAVTTLAGKALNAGGTARSQ